MEAPALQAPIRPDSSLSRRDRYPLWHDVPTRYGDLDPLGHVNNVAITRLYEEARVLFEQTLRQRHAFRPARGMLVQLNVHYLGETRYPEPVQIGTGIKRLGRASYTLAQAMYQGGRCVGVSDATVAHVPADGPGPLPDDFRSALETALLR
ncbi:acyl-CoA thioesterase [Amycolatopsis acidiphila]|uniref:Acyl-CoA thioesterase n=1 Tax=Amycolatopsis acidiphila TaxID=715473 RepID=A0A558AB03_9PSEU|nr:acyl-CoA thioesterase [Amycolatopsis acidiphila]TVT21449.1 acyl-CoA thioesterase [Amycolatopsis acidiphila]UIJ63126.1 acyl-CoA thioesterase [Amycolatopsis acidiphila]GHG73877.1 thioesterase [Amycolatopsis acidiphila]